MIRFEPIYKPTIWGNRRFALHFGRTLPAGSIGESWELVEYGARHSRVQQGPYAGRFLGDLWRTGALGGSARGRFPFLLKWIDTGERLSVQVHPDAATVSRLGRGSPKTEAWYVAHAEPEATVMLGHAAGLDAATLRRAAETATVEQWLYEIAPEAGDMLYVEAGTIHSIGAGLLLLEVQQPSDTTFRIYDWGRTNEHGEPRTLHLDDACASVHYSKTDKPRIWHGDIEVETFVLRPLHSPAVVADVASLRVFVATDDHVQLETSQGIESLHAGDVVVAEPNDGEITLRQGHCVLVGEGSLKS